jgi:hypothetical protein
MLAAILSRQGDVRTIVRFLAACGRRVEHLMTETGSRRALEVAERWAAGGITEEELIDAWEAAHAAVDVTPGDGNDCPAVSAATVASDTLYIALHHDIEPDAPWGARELTEAARQARCARGDPHRHTYQRDFTAEELEAVTQAELLRGIAGNPFAKR